MRARIKDAALAALLAGLLALPFIGVRSTEGIAGQITSWHLSTIALIMLGVFVGRLAWISILARASLLRWRESHGKIFNGMPAFAGMTPVLLSVRKFILQKPYLIIALLIVFPFLPMTDRYMLDVAIMVLTYVMLAWGLTITVGFAGLLDLGYVAFYAIGAYCYALLAQFFGLSFWQALPLAAALAAGVGLVLGLPVLRLRGDYFAIVTLGFGEITRLVLINWSNLTGGPNGISGVPRPTLFGLEFARSASEGQQTFHAFFNLTFDPLQRVIFMYYIILCLALLTGGLVARLRQTSLGRALEAYREDEIAAAAIGINRWRIKLAAYALSATVAGVAGAFFAARQGFVSPESFTFLESATILAIIILGGAGRLWGIVLAALFIIGLPEAFREFEQFRMLAFGAGMVLIMLWRPGGLTAEREATVRYGVKQ
jgi:branched-chain amino acid transport system permease protein